ncbi:ribokinase [Massilia polaris]|nr:ribokinase [Massilia polaris]
MVNKQQSMDVGNAVVPRVVVVGSVNMDLVFRTPRMPAPGETITGDGFQQVPGGKGANQAVAAARQGAAVGFVGMIGNDSFGQMALESLGREGIATTHMTTDLSAASGVAGIFVDDHGENSIVLAPGANAVLSEAHVEAAAAAIGGADYLICQLESPIASVARAIAIAREHGVRVVFNPAPAAQLPDGLLASVDYLILNETEATQLTGLAVLDRASAAEAAAALLARGAGAVLLTMGAGGVLVATTGHERFVPAVKVKAVDTTAAGDTFVGALTVAIGRGLDLDDAVTQAQHAAALTVTRMGAQTSIPTRAELHEFIQSTHGREVT